MKGYLSRSVLVVLAVTFICSTLSYSDDRADGVLQSAESLFKSMKQGQHKQIWQLLSAKSRQRIVDDIYRNTVKTGRPADKEQIAGEMGQGGPTAVAYWNSFLQNFDPDMVLEQSKWELGPIKKDRAEIVITYRKSEHPARLKLYREGGAWKVGLVETFFVGK